MSQRWSRTRSGSKYVNLDTLSPLQGVADGHNRLSGDLQHNGATADQGMQMAAEVLDNKQHWYEALDIQYQAMEQELERYRTVMADSMARMKAQNKAARDSRQAQLEAQEKSLAEFRQKQAEEEARNQEARQQAFRQLVSPDQSLSWESLLAEWYELEKSFDELELTKEDDSREDFRILKVDEEQLFLEWSLIEKALDAESRLERKMGGEEDSGYLVDMNCKIRAIISDAQCRIQDIVTTALKDIHDCQQVDVLTRPRPHVANVDYDCSSVRDITPKVDLTLSKDCSDSAPPIDETARGCTDSLHCSGSAKCDCDVKTSSMTVKVPEESTELAPSTIVDQGVSDVEYSRARIRLGNFPQDSTELAPGTIVDQGVGDVEDTRISVSLEDSLEDSAYFTHLSTVYSDSDVECQRLNSASTSHSVLDTHDGVILGWDLAASVEPAAPSMVADSNGQLQVESSIQKVNLSEPKELGIQSSTSYHRRVHTAEYQLEPCYTLAPGHCGQE